MTESGQYAIIMMYSIRKLTLPQTITKGITIMITETMTIHKALTELKMLDKRIKSKIESLDPVTYTRGNPTGKKVNGVSAEDWMVSARSDFDSVEKLISRRNAIKQALSTSNSQLTVKICGKEYTVAAAIELNKSGLEYYEQLVERLTYKYNSVCKSIESKNAAVEENALEYAKAMLGTAEKSKLTSAEAENLRQTFINNNEAVMLDPIRIVSVINELRTFIDKFKTESDSELAVSNATNTITIEY